MGVIQGLAEPSNMEALVGLLLHRDGHREGPKPFHPTGDGLSQALTRQLYQTRTDPTLNAPVSFTLR